MRRPPTGAKQLVIRHLEAQGVRYATADYWIAYYITYLTSERKGGIANAGTLALTLVDVTNNVATERGGGIYNKGSTFITASTIANNRTPKAGGGLLNAFEAIGRVVGSTFSGNVAEVGGVDTREDYLDAGRTTAPANVLLQQADVMSLPFGYAEFDLVCCHRVLHHVRRPELAVSELARVARPRGKIFIADQLGSIDPVSRRSSARNHWPARPSVRFLRAIAWPFC